jgi:hypothetical protein
MWRTRLRVAARPSGTKAKDAHLAPFMPVPTTPPPRGDHLRQRRHQTDESDESREVHAACGVSFEKRGRDKRPQLQDRNIRGAMSKK